MFATYYRQVGTQSHIDIGGYSTDFADSDDEVAWVDLESDDHWTVDLNRINYGEAEIECEAGTALVDTGTALVYFPETEYTSIMNAIDSSDNLNCGFTIDGYPACECTSEDDFEIVTFKLGEYLLTMIPDEYIQLDTSYNPNMCLISILQIDPSLGDHTILLGDAFVRNFYIVHDLDQTQLGFVAYDGREIVHEPVFFTTLMIILLVCVGLVVVFIVILIVACVIRGG